MADFLLSVGVDVGLSYDQMQKDISNLVSQLNNNPPKIKVSLDIDNASIESFRNQVAEISKSLNGLGTVSVNSDGSVSDVNEKLKERIALEKESARASSESAASKKASDYSYKKSEEQKQALLKKSYTLLTQMQNAQDKWTAAKDGKSATSYTAIQKDITALDRLIAKYNDGDITAEKFSAALKELSANFAHNSNVIKGAGENTKTWSERLGSLSAKFGTWFSITRVIMAAYRAVKQMVTNVIELDTAMTELKKVTNETDATYERFLVNATHRAKELGASLSDTVNATADFARLGYGIEDAEKLADAAIVYKNVGDGIEDIGTASESIIATMQAFGIPAEQVMSIVDRFNEVGNNFAISSKGVGDALLRSAAALHSANNTLDESIALAAAANTIVQDPEKVGTTLKTVSMYLRAAKTDAEEAGESTDGMANSVSELREELLALTGNKVDIQLNENTFKSTYQILKELSVVWHELTDISQANILEMVGGKRNSNVVSALLENFSVAEEAITTSANSAGSALSENEKVLESIHGKLNIMKATFETLSQNFIGSDIVKFVIDIVTGLMELINGILKVVDALGGLKTVLLTVGAALLISKGGLIAYKVALLGVAAAEKIVTFFTGLKNGIMNIVSIIPNAISAWQAYAAGIVSANTAIQASIPVIGLVLAAISAVVAGISMAGGSMDNTKKSIEELEQEWEDLSGTVKETAEEFRSLKQNADEIIPRYAELAQGVDKYGENVSLTDKEFEEFVSLNNQLGEMFPDLVVGYDANGNAILNLSGNVDTLTESIYACVEAQRAAAAQEIADTMPKVVENINDTTDALENQIDKLNDNKDALKNFYQHLKSGGTPNKIQRQGAYYDGLIEGERKQFYDEFGVSQKSYTEMSYPATNASRGVRVTKFKYVFDEGEEENLQENYEAAEAIIDRQIKAIEAKITAKNKQINPVISAWLQTNFIYNDLDKTGQDIVSQIVKSIDFKEKGLDTAEKIQKYIEDDIISPLYDAEPVVKNAIAGLFELKGGFEADAATVGEYKALVDNIINDLKAAGLSDDIIQQIKITMDTEGFEEKLGYVKGLLSDEYDSMVDTLTSSELDVAYQIIAKEGSMTFDELKSKIEELKFETAPMVNVLDFGNMTSSLDKAKDGLDSIIDAMGKLRGGTALTKSELAQLALEYPKLLEASNLFTDGSVQGQKAMLNSILDMHEQEYDAQIDKKIKELEATEQVLQDQLDLETQKANLVQEIKNLEVNGVVEQEDELVKKIAELNDLQGKNYVTMEDGVLTVNQEALNKHLGQQEEFGKESATNVWTPYGNVIKKAHSQGFSKALEAANTYGSKLVTWAKNLGSNVWSGIGNAVKDALSGEWKGLSAYFSGVATDIAPDDISVSFDGGNAYVDGSSLTDWVSEQEEAYNLRIEQTKDLLTKTLNAKNNLAALKGLDLADVYGGSNNKNNNKDNKGQKDKDKKEVDEYIAEVERYNEALQKLNDVEKEQANLEGNLENADNSLDKLNTQKELVKVYAKKQEALHNLNNLRDETIRNTIRKLEDVGFQIDYNDETNRLYISNLEHLNELQASSAGKYETIQEATNALRKETEGLIDDITNLNKENENSSKEWGEMANKIKTTRREIVDTRMAISEHYLKKKDVLGWGDDDSEVEARWRILQWFSSDYYKSLFENEEEWYQEFLVHLDNFKKAVNNELSDAVSSVQNYYDSYKKQIDETNERLDKQASKTQGLLDIINKEYEATKQLADAQHEADKAIADSLISKSYLNESEYAMIYNEDDYKKMSGIISDLGDDISTLTSNFRNQVLECYEKDQTYLIESITAEYERQVELKMRELDIARAELELTKKQTQLNNVLAERNVKQIVERDGKLQWEWVADTEKVRSATEEFNDAKYQLEQSQQEREQQDRINRYQRTIDKFKDIQETNNASVEELGEYVDSVKNSVDELQNPIMSLGIAIDTFEKQGVAGLSSVVNDLISVMSKLTPSESHNKIAVSNKKVVNVNPDGNAPKGLSVGTTVKTAGGNYLITAVNPDGSYKSKRITGGYARGIRKANHGVHEVNENGGESYISKEGIFHNFEGGEYVFDNEQTRHLWEMSKKMSSVLSVDSKSVPGSLLETFGYGDTKTFPSVQSNATENRYSFGDIVIQNPANFNDFTRQLVNTIRRKTV